MYTAMQMKLGMRLALSFSLMMVLTAVIAVSSAGALRSVMGSFRAVSNDAWPKVDIANRNIRAAYDYARAFAYIVTSEGRSGTDLTAIKSAYGVLAETVKTVNENIAELEKTLSSDEEKQLLGNVKLKRAAYGKSRNQVLELKKAGQNDKVVDHMFTETNSLQTVYIESWKEFIAHEQSLLTRGVQVAENTYEQSIATLYAILAMSLVAGVSVTIFLSRWVSRALGGEPSYAAEIAHRIAAGDLATDVKIRADDRSSLLFAMKTMRDNLTNVVAEVRAGTDSIAVATAHVASGNLDLSSRTEEQASALEQTAASMEELSSTVKQNADNARQGNQLAQSASAVAVKGGQVVGQVVETMKGINDASKKIADIIQVIDSIAFQTNILALNAAVEAARAGEQGRGFAVVASEVRSLAGRSADAAKEIKTLINASVERVEQGSVLVNQAGTTMSEVVSSIRRVTDIMGEISAASTEQSAGVAQVGEAITQMDQATQQNAALVEESAAAAGSLKSQAQQLVQAVAVFKLGEQAQSHAVSTLATPLARLSAPPARKSFPAVERRGPDRTKNVTRLPPKPARAEPPVLTNKVATRSAPTATGSDDWTSF